MVVGGKRIDVEGIFEGLKGGRTRGSELARKEIGGGGLTDHGEISAVEDVVVRAPICTIHPRMEGVR